MHLSFPEWAGLSNPTSLTPTETKSAIYVLGLIYLREVLSFTHLHPCSDTGRDLKNVTCTHCILEVFLVSLNRQ